MNEQKSSASFESNGLKEGSLELLKHNLTAVPAGMIEGGHKRNRGKKGKSILVSKVFNSVAARPGPSRLLLTPTITVLMQATQLAAFASSATIPAYYGSYVPLSLFDNYLEYASLFDQYRIDEVEVWIEPQISQSTSMPNTGVLITAVDLDDANTPAAIATVQDKQGAIQSTCYAGHYHKWKPHMAVAVYSGTFTSFSNAPANWIDSASPSVQHYGIKYATEPTSVIINFNLTFRAKVSFRAPGI
jgi:hypothetical protein